MSSRNGRIPPSPYDPTPSSGQTNRPLDSGGDFFGGIARPGEGDGFAPQGGSSRYSGFNAPPSAAPRPVPRAPKKRGHGAAGVVLTLILVLAIAAAGLFAWRYLYHRDAGTNPGSTGDISTPGGPDQSAGTPNSTPSGQTTPGQTSGQTAPNPSDSGNGGSTGGNGSSDDADPSDVRELAARIIPHFETRYFLQNLSDERLAFVCEFYEAAMAFEEKPKITAGDISVCTAALTADCPELFQLDFTRYSYSYSYNTAGYVVGLELQYVMDEAEYEQRRQACESAIAQIVSGAAGLDQLGRERAAFDAIGGPAIYDKDSEMCGNAYGALVEHRAKCIGFAHAMKWAMDEFGIETTTISAGIPGQEEGHAWNQVCLDGRWYRVDLTASAAGESDTDIGFERPIYYALNISDFIDETEYILDEDLQAAAPIPVCASMDLSPYALEGKLVRTGEDGAARLNEALDTAYTTGDGHIILQFEDKNEYANVLNNLSSLVADYTAPLYLGYSYQIVHSDQFNLMTIAITFVS